jgi:transcriptional regulator with XRE-family HTH domain
LRELRARRFRSASEMARNLGWQPSRVSKLELGTQLPSADDLTAWVAATGADTEVRAQLDELLTQARIRHTVFSEEYRAGTIASNQALIGQAEAGARLIREYRPSLIPGIVHTVAYARELLTIPGGLTLTGGTPQQAELIIAERLKRQQLLYQPGRRIQILLGEAALRVHFGTVDALLGQLDRLVAVSGLEAVELGILPARVASPLMPMAGFRLNDDQTLIVEILTREIESSDPEEIEAHVKAFEIAWEVAAKGPDAVALIARVAAQLRG